MKDLINSLKIIINKNLPKIRSLFRNLNSNLNKYQPKSLFSRFLLITIIPVILLQIFNASFFYNRHWESISRNMSNSLSGDILLIYNAVYNANEKEMDNIFAASNKFLNINTKFEKDAKISDTETSITDYEELISSILNSEDTVEKISLTQNDQGDFTLKLEFSKGLLSFDFSKKRLANPTTSIFAYSIIGSALLLIVLSTLFLRGQIRSIVSLSNAAEKFGKGHDTKDFQPQGAREIRLAGTAFIEMKERIKRLLNTRTQMLAGVSHDLKTPLTRINLNAAMISDPQKRKDISEDIESMQKMIDGYLKFAELEISNKFEEPSVEINVKEFAKKIAEKNQTENCKITVSVPDNIFLSARADLFSRAISNIVENATHFAKNVSIRAQKLGDNFVNILIDDDGVGIPDESYDEVFQPFFRIDPSRNSNTGGVGLGLTIAKDIIHKHGGEIRLSESHLGGLRATITMPN